MTAANPIACFDSVSIPREENEMSRRYLDILTRWIPIGMSVYADWPVRPDCGHFFGGVYWYGMETAYSILPIAAAVSSSEFDAKKAGYSADELRAVVLRGLRYLLFTHDTGPEDCVRPTITQGTMDQSGRKWGERGRTFFRQSQCAWTVTAMIQAAALIKDLLTDEELQMFGTVAADYIDRFGEMAPMSGVYNDTQTEENGWTAMGLASSLSILPHIENQDKLWDQTKLWMFRTATLPQDAQNSCEFDGKPVSAWCGRTFTTLPDFTAENHGFVHPTYMSAAVVLAGMTMNVLGHFGKPTPPQIHWRREDTYDLCKRWCDRLGNPHCPQGMDWPYLRHVWPACMHAFANCYYADSDAALLERASLEVVERSSAAQGGGLVNAQAKAYAQSAGDQAMMEVVVLWELNAEVAAQAYLCHRLNGPGAAPSDDADLRKRMAGSYVYPSGGIVLHNHARGISSFSWRNRTMVLPAPGEGVKLIGPSGHSILGTYKVSGKGSSENVRKLVVRELPDRVSALMIQDIAGDTVRRRVFFCSLPDGTGLSYEIAHALSDITVEECTLGYLQIINDSYFGDTSGSVDGIREGEAPAEPVFSSRTIHWSGGERDFRGYISGNADDEVTCDLSGSDWVNVDDRMGFRFAGTGSPAYVNRHYYQKFHAIYDELILGRHPEARSFKAGDKIAELVVLWCPEQDHEATSRQKFTVLDTPPDTFAARVDDWLCACNFGLTQFELEGVVLEPMEPRLASAITLP